jgi:hypothetical protein
MRHEHIYQLQYRLKGASHRQRAKHVATAAATRRIETI